MTTKEPKGATMLAARLARAYPYLPAYSAATLAEELCAIERAQRRHAVRCCSGEDGGYVRWIRGLSEGDNIVHRPIHDPAEERAGKRIERQVAKARDRLRQWLLGSACSAEELLRRSEALQAFSVELHGDPRGAVLTVRLPGDAEAVAV